MGYYWSPAGEGGSTALRGRPLRYLLVVLLADAGQPLEVRELVVACEDEGIVFDGRASKLVSDALRWEVRSGRVNRLGRGRYVLAAVPRSTMRWIRQRNAQTRFWLSWMTDPVNVSSIGPSTSWEWWPWPNRSWVTGWPCWSVPDAFPGADRHPS